MFLSSAAIGVVRLTHLKYSKVAHLASSFILAWRRPSTRTTSTLLSDKREVEALTRRSVKLCTELVESWRETEGTWGATNDDDDDENPGDKMGTMVEVRESFEA
jgi:hypothetical protein